MSTCSVTVATYDELIAAERDWDFLDVQGRAGVVSLVDAVLVDSDQDTVRALMRFSDLTAARGSVSSAVVVLLRPAALVLGAVAGGVGETMLVAVSHGIHRADVHQLGEVLDEGRFAIIVVAVRPEETDVERPTSLAWRSARAATTVDLDATEADMMWAMLADSAIE